MQKIHTAEAPEAIGPYTQAIEAGGFVFTSGQIPIDPCTGRVEAQEITGQATRVCENLKAVLAAAGCTLEDVVKTTCFLQDMADFSAFNDVYAAYFTGCPARSCVAVRTLPKGVLVEVEAVAVKR